LWTARRKCDRTRGAGRHSAGRRHRERRRIEGRDDRATEAPARQGRRSCRAADRAQWPADLRPRARRLIAFTMLATKAADSAAFFLAAAADFAAVVVSIGR